MVFEGAEVVVGVRIETPVEKGGDGLALGVERTGGNVHQMVKTGKEIRLVGGKIGETRHIECHDADGTGRFARAEETAALFAELA